MYPYATYVYDETETVAFFFYFFMETEKKNIFFTSWKNISIRKVTVAKQSFRLFVVRLFTFLP